ncbi:MAG TPA: branched-chain amino acid ABC transporter permease [Acidimicrobiales bacterium]|nr:branched-chain amino acid ABC transporter permease [Acidimicrobiales bacterium]
MRAVAQGLIDGVLTGGVYALMAAGLTLIFGVLDVINVAQAILVVVGAYLSYTLSIHLGLDLFLGLLVTMPAMFLFGAVMEWGLIRRLRGLHQGDFVVMAILASYAVATITEGVLDLVYGPNYVELQAPYVNRSYVLWGMHFPEIYVFGFLMALVLLSAFYAVLYRTRFGKMLRASVQNRTAARLIGINVDRVAFIVFGIGISICAAGGMIFGATNAFNANSGADLVSRLLTIIVLGGLGSIGGSLIAAILMIALQNLVAVVWSPIWSSAVFSIVLISVMVIRPNGLFGRIGARAQ